MIGQPVAGFADPVPFPPAAGQHRGGLGIAVKDCSHLIRHGDGRHPDHVLHFGQTGGQVVRRRLPCGQDRLGHRPAALMRQHRLAQALRGLDDQLSASFAPARARRNVIVGSARRHAGPSFPADRRQSGRPSHRRPRNAYPSAPCCTSAACRMRMERQDRRQPIVIARRGVNGF